MSDMKILPRNRTVRRILSWQDVEQAVNLIAEYYQRRPLSLGIAEVVPISRGGLVMAAMLAYRLNARVKYLIDPQEILGPPDDYDEGDLSTTLIVDDIYDAGATLRKVREIYEGAQFAVLCSHAIVGGLCPWGISAMWVTFPWSPGDAEEGA